MIVLKKSEKQMDNKENQNDKDYCLVADEYDNKCLWKHRCSTCPVLNDIDEEEKQKTS